MLIYLLYSVSLQAISNKDQHSISYTLSRVQMVVVEYTHDSNTDMFQVASLGFDPDWRSVSQFLLSVTIMTALILTGGV